MMVDRNGLLSILLCRTRRATLIPKYRRHYRSIEQRPRLSYLLDNVEHLVVCLGRISISTKYSALDINQESRQRETVTTMQGRSWQ